MAFTEWKLCGNFKLKNARLVCFPIENSIEDNLRSSVE